MTFFNNSILIIRTGEVIFYIKNHYFKSAYLLLFIRIVNVVLEILEKLKEIITT